MSLLSKVKSLFLPKDRIYTLQTQLEEEKARLEASINSLNVGFIMTDAQANIMSTNGAARRILCVTPDSPAGSIKDDSKVNYDCTMEDIERQLGKDFDLVTHIDTCLKTKTTIEFRGISFRGLFLHFFLTPIVILRSDKLQVLGVVVLIEDTTEESTLDRSKDEFFSIASHELRTPLTAIRGNTSMILDYFGDKLTDPVLKEMIVDIKTSSVRLIEIVNDFLNVSRLEQGKIKFEKEQVDLPLLIEQVIQELKNSANERNLTLKYEMPTQVILKVLADSKRVREVLINLISNAIKYTDRGTINIKITPENEFMKVLVEDTGRGIAYENQGLLFKKFQQAETSLFTRDTTKSTGLGLYISKLMVEGMEGKIKLESSELGKGSIFSFTLPIFHDIDTNNIVVQNSPTTI